MKNLNGKLAVVTGGSSGIGFCTARELILKGCNVVILARRIELLESSQKKLQSHCIHPHQRVIYYQVDLADYLATTRVFELIEEEMGVPDILVNSAGISRPGLFEEMDISHFYNAMNINFLGTLHPIKAIVPGMIKRNSGHITLISSIAGFVGVYGYSAYSPSKYAIVGLADVLRTELKSHGIQISLVYPPDTNTPQFIGEEPYKPALTKALSEGNAKMLEPDIVARYIVNAIEKRKYLVIPPGETRVLYAMVSLLGLWRYPIMDMFIADAERRLRRLGK